MKNQILDVFGGLGDALSESLVDAFKNGTDAAENFRQSINGILEDFMADLAMSVLFADNFEQLEEGLKTALKTQEQSQSMADLYREMAKSPNADSEYLNEVADSWEKYGAEAIPKELEEFFSGLTEDIENYDDVIKMFQDASKKYGFDIFQPGEEEGSTALRGSVENITEDTADLLASYVNAIRADVSLIRIDWDKTVNDLLPKMNVIASAQLSQLTQIAANTGRNAEIVEDIYDILKGNVNGTNKFAVK